MRAFGNSFVKSFEASIPEEAKAGLAKYDEAVAQHGEMKTKSGRDVLKFAAVFPTILVIAFGFIALYFRSRGGYKPAEISSGDEPESAVL